MSITVLTSAARSPGVTTTALGLSLCWPRDVLLVDADRQPSQAILAGYLQGENPGGGLWTVLAAHRERHPLAEAVLAASVDLDPGGEVERRFLPGFTHPGMVELFAPAWPAFVSALDDLRLDVVVDAGRIGTDGLPPDLAAQADAVVVLSGTSLPDLVALRLYLPLVAEAAPGRVMLALVGPGRPYRAGEIADQFEVPVLATLPWAVAEASVWSHGAVPSRRFTTSAYVHDVRAMADELVSRLLRSAEAIGVPA